MRRVLVVAGALLLAGCSAAGGASTVDSGPRAGGTVTFALASDPTCADPQQAGSNDSIYPARQLVD